MITSKFKVNYYPILAVLLIKTNIIWTFILCILLKESVAHFGKDIFFEIVEPESLRYTFQLRAAQDFGVPFNTTLQNVGLTIAEPHHGCNSPINPLELKNNIALVERGGCSFLTKCIQSAASGALAVICADNDISNDEQFIEMVDDKTKRNCSIPALFLLGKDGHMIRQGLHTHRLNRAIINIPINVTTLPLEKLKQPPWLLW